MANDPGDVSLKLLSSSTDGKPILIAGTAGAPTVVHTSQANTDEIDLVALFVNNTDASATITLFAAIYSGASPTTPDDVACTVDIPPKSGAWVVLDGAPVTNGKKVGCWGSTINLLTATGKVGRTTVAL